MKQHDSDLWTADAPLRFLGLEIGTRMTVVRLPGPKLWLHSPVPAAMDLVREVRALGPVADLVAPNRLHHLYVGEWKQAFPEARIHAAPGLDTKRRDLEIASVLGETPDPDWADVIDQVVLDGFPMANEVVFFHRPSATLIASDLAFNIGESSPASTRVAFRMLGAYGKLAPSLAERILIRDRPAFRRSLEKILEWPFERVVIAHGEVTEKGARESLERGYDWLPKAG